MERFLSEHAAVAIWFGGGLVSMLGLTVSTFLAIGYRHMMKRFDNIDENEARNQKEHREIVGRLIRVETLVINGGKKA